MGWFNTKDPETMTTRYVEDLSKFKAAIGQRNHVVIYGTAMALASFAIGFKHNWWFSFLLIITCPITLVGLVMFVFALAKESKVTKESYEKAGGIAEQAFNAIKTVKSLYGESHELGVYDVLIEHAKKQSSKYGLYAGLSLGLFFASTFLGYGLNFFIGSMLVDKSVLNYNSNASYNVKDVITIFFAFMAAGLGLGYSAPALKSIMTGIEATSKIYAVLNRRPKLVIEDLIGVRPDSVDGDIDIRNVEFRYP